jgi:hypothetical protein
MTLLTDTKLCLSQQPGAHRRGPRAVTTSCLVLLSACALAGCATSAPSEVGFCPPSIVPGLDGDGRPTQQWIDAIRDRVDASELTTIAQTAKPLSAEEDEWRTQIESEARVWCASIPRLNAPFQHVTPPRETRILLGNQGGGDGFTHDPDDVAFDLGEMSRAYASAASETRRALIHRLLAHEYTHLLLHRQLDATGWSEASVVDDAFLKALRTLYNEGLANYRSIENERWVAASGELTQHARETLEVLQPVMIERLQGLVAHPSPEEASRLLRNISQGPLERKWGAIPIALWLATATHGDPRRIAAWIEAEPDGILALAVQYGDPQYREAFAHLLEGARVRTQNRKIGE